MPNTNGHKPIAVRVGSLISSGLFKDAAPRMVRVQYEIMAYCEGCGNIWYPALEQREYGLLLVMPQDPTLRLRQFGVGIEHHARVHPQSRVNPAINAPYSSPVFYQYRRCGALKLFKPLNAVLAGRVYIRAITFEGIDSRIRYLR